MPCHTRIKHIMKGLLWLFLIQFGFDLVMSLEPGFLDFDNLPDTNFTCVGKVIGGYYADLETNCQMFHVCTIGQLDEPMDIRFLCLNGTVFDQETRVCERIDEVDCSKSEKFYSLNLELYGNTQPPILEEDVSVEDKSFTTTTSTTQKATVAKPTLRPYFTTSSIPKTTTREVNVITSHHFPVANAPDIRFNPEEINISLHPHAPPDITRSNVPVSFQHQSLSNSETNTKVTITTHTDYKVDKPHHISLLNSSKNSEESKTASSTPKSVVSYGLTHDDHPKTNPKDVNYGFSYEQSDESLDYPSRTPVHPYRYQLDNQQSTGKSHPYLHYHTTTKRPARLNYPTTTYRSYTTPSQSTKQQHYQPEETKRLNLQLPSPLFPTLPPVSFSSPAPFSLAHHPETKRFTHNHNSPPRIVISASASVSDNSGRRLNYSLGTIGATHLLGPSPPSYDDYKEEDVVSDPFYHDVPKLKKGRTKRSTSERERDDDLLNFLFDLYKKREMEAKVPSILAEAVAINSGLKPVKGKESLIEEEDDEVEKKAVSFKKSNENLPKKQEIQTSGFTSKEVGLITDFFEQIIADNKADRFTTSNPIKVTTAVEEEFFTTRSYFQETTTAREEPFTLVNNLDKNEITTNKVDIYYAVTPGKVQTTAESNSVTSTPEVEQETTVTLKSAKGFTNEVFEELTTVTSSPLRDSTEAVFEELTTTNNPLKDQTTWFDSNPKTTTTKNEFIQKINSLDRKSQVFDFSDYVDDNYEPLTYQEPESKNFSAQSLKSLKEKTISSKEVVKTVKPDSQSTTTEAVSTTNFITTTELPETTTFSEEVTLPSTTKLSETTAASFETSTHLPETSTTRYQYLKTKTPWYKRPSSSKRKEYGSHRFSTPRLNKNSLNNDVKHTTAPSNESWQATKLTSDIWQTKTPTSDIWQTKTPSNNNWQTNTPTSNGWHTETTTSDDSWQTTTPTSDSWPTTTPTNDEAFVTEAPLLKSANPTKAKYTKITFTTTPLSKLIQVEFRKEKPGKLFTFNCFDKKVHKFYSDPRDCRLFHYCTFGYTRTQMVDMKFVCDFGTFFDDEKLICSKGKPSRCT